MSERKHAYFLRNHDIHDFQHKTLENQLKGRGEGSVSYGILLSMRTMGIFTTCLLQTSCNRNAHYEVLLIHLFVLPKNIHF